MNANVLLLAALAARRVSGADDIRVKYNIQGPHDSNSCNTSPDPSTAVVECSPSSSDIGTCLSIPDGALDGYTTQQSLYYSFACQAVVSGNALIETPEFTPFTDTSCATSNLVNEGNSAKSWTTACVQSHTGNNWYKMSSAVGATELRLCNKKDAANYAVVADCAAGDTKYACGVCHGLPAAGLLNPKASIAADATYFKFDCAATPTWGETDSDLTATTWKNDACSTPSTTPTTFTLVTQPALYGTAGTFKTVTYVITAPRTATATIMITDAPTPEPTVANTTDNTTESPGATTGTANNGTGDDDDADGAETGSGGTHRSWLALLAVGVPAGMVVLAGF